MCYRARGCPSTSGNKLELTVVSIYSRVFNFFAHRPSTVCPIFFDCLERQDFCTGLTDTFGLKNISRQEENLGFHHYQDQWPLVCTTSMLFNIHHSSPWQRIVLDYVSHSHRKFKFKSRKLFVACINHGKLVKIRLWFLFGKYWRTVPTLSKGSFSWKPNNLSLMRKRISF